MRKKGEYLEFEAATGLQGGSWYLGEGSREWKKSNDCQTIGQMQSLAGPLDSGPSIFKMFIVIVIMINIITIMIMIIVIRIIIPIIISVKHKFMKIFHSGLLMIWLIGLSLLVVHLLWRKTSNAKLNKHPPGPRCLIFFLQRKSLNVFFHFRPWPLIGSLHLLGKFKRIPFEAFTALQKVKIPSIPDTLQLQSPSWYVLISGIWTSCTTAHGQLECCRG